MKNSEPTIYDISSPGRKGVNLPIPDVPIEDIPDDLLRKDLNLPELTQLDVIRHFQQLSQLNHSIDSGFYPLGSCTMKYNPRVNEDAARMPGFLHSHPLQDINTIQGNLALMYELQELLKEIGGFKGVTLQPAAGAHGELTGIMMMRDYHLSRGDTARNKILIPDSAHGTNPASTTMSGLEVIEIPSDSRGNVDIDILKSKCGDDVVGLMITNPNTLGLFEEQIKEVVKIIHDCGGLIYGDGANMNALTGILRPGDIGFDVMHYNLHKTFSTPHGGGGPGSGPVGVSERLVDFLPAPIITIIEEGDEDNPPLFGFTTPKHTIGRIKAFNGQFGVLVRAYTYIRIHGSSGLRSNSEHAVLNANYLRSKIEKTYNLPYKRACLHEFVVEGCWQEAPNIHALDISKRLMDFGFHPPTNYFPLIVREALMIEPTETESKETLDKFADVLLQIADEAKTDPQVLIEAPHNTPNARLDEVQAARQLVLCCRPAYLPEPEPMQT